MKKEILMKYLFYLLIAGLISNILHEFSHWLAYKLLGFNAGFTLNTTYLKDSSNALSNIQRIITSGAGPLFTIIQAIVFYLFLKKKENLFLYPFLLYPFVLRFGATIANIFQPNDEGRISLILGLNLYAISVIVDAILLFLVFRLSKKYHYSFLFNFLSFLFLFILMTIMSILDAKFNLKII
jgi:hypothetical protein